MLENNKPQDYVLATGRTTSIRKFAEVVSSLLSFDLVWEGEGLDERGYDKTSGRLLISIDENFYRPCEVDCLIGNPQKAERELNWKREYSLELLIDDMIKGEQQLFVNKEMSLSIYHGEEEWILKGLAVDLEAAFEGFPNYPVQRVNSFGGPVGDTKYHFLFSKASIILLKDKKLKY